MYLPEYNSARVSNILMVLGRIIQQVSAVAWKNDKSVCLRFLIKFPDPDFYLVSGA